MVAKRSQGLSRPAVSRIIMSVLDPSEHLTDAEIQHTLGALRDVGGPPVSRPARVSVKLKNRPSYGKIHPLELSRGVGLNETIEVTVKLPAYMVAALMAESRGTGDKLDNCVREAVREWLDRKRLGWVWQPRFLAVVRARQIEAKQRFTRNSV